tara:strand:+ start:395 stop:748 length:354 start_codon:yes stop_codon:yes gene_type:complete
MSDDTQSPFDEAREHIKRTSTWTRGLYIILFAVFFYIAGNAIHAVVVFQFLHTLLTGKPHPRLQSFGQSLSTYAYQILAYLSYNSNTRPYPFSAWPKGALSGGVKKRTPKEKAEENA